MKEWYSGKAAGNQALPIGKYTTIDKSLYTLPVPTKGIINYALYLNLDLILKPGYLTGVVRLRAVRQPIEDATAYLDFTVTRRYTKTSEAARTSDVIDWIVTHDWSMGADTAIYKSLRWDVKPGPEFFKATANTRYTKAFLS
jgi:hypothetical protein